MIFLANRANLDKRTLLSRLHKRLQTQTDTESSPIKQVWYHTSFGSKTGVRCTLDTSTFLETTYPVDEAELHAAFDFPPNQAYDFYKIQWVESERNLMLGWHQDETHMDIGECHFQLDHQGKTIQRDAARFLDTHPLNVFDQRTGHLVEIVSSLTWENEFPEVPTQVIQ